MSHEELSNRNNITVSFLQILQIRSSLPFNWRRLLTNPATPNLAIKPLIKDTENTILDISSLSSKKLYSILICRKRQGVAAQRKWDLEFPPPVGVPVMDYWETNYKTPFRSIRETKLQAFQFKLLHRILPCGKYLKSIRVKDTDLCQYCGNVDTLTHFFFSCPRIWSAQQINIQLGNTAIQHFMLGIPHEHPQAKISIYIILVAKFYTFRQKLYHDSNLNLTAFLYDLRSKLKTEKYICTLENKADKFNTWERVLSALG